MVLQRGKSPHSHSPRASLAWAKADVGASSVEFQPKCNIKKHPSKYPPPLCDCKITSSAFPPSDTTRDVMPRFQHEVCTKFVERGENIPLTVPPPQPCHGAFASRALSSFLRRTHTLGGERVARVGFIDYATARRKRLRAPSALPIRHIKGAMPFPG